MRFKYLLFALLVPIVLFAGTAINKSNFYDVNTSADLTKLDHTKYWCYTGMTQEEIRVNLPECNRKYWINNGSDYPAEMTNAQKDSVDLEAVTSAEVAEAAQRDINRMTVLEKAVLLVLLDAINLERVARGASRIETPLYRTSVISKCVTLEE